MSESTVDAQTRNARLMVIAWNRDVHARDAAECLLDGRADMARKHAGKYAKRKAEYASLMAEAAVRS